MSKSIKAKARRIHLFIRYSPENKKTEICASLKLQVRHNVVALVALNRLKLD